MARAALPFRLASRRTVALGLCTVTGTALLFACEQDEVSRVDLVMKTPKGVLDGATQMELAVFDAAGAVCNELGFVEVPDGANTFALSQSGCADGAIWCGEITLDRDGSTKMFSVIASSAAGNLAQGCATATIDQDPVRVDIQVKKFNPPACCNDGVLQAGETCEGTAAPTDCAGGPGGECVAITPDEVCECNCNTKELPLDRGSDPGLTVPAQGTKRELAFVFALGSEKINNGLRAVFTDAGAGANGGADVQVRVMQPNLFTTTDPPTLSGPLRIPLACTSPNAGGVARQQTSPAIANLDANNSPVVFLSDFQQAGQFDVILTNLNGDGCADTPPAAGGIEVTGPGGSAGAPDIAAAPGLGQALAVWTQDGQVKARTWSPTTGLGTEIVIGPGSEPTVAGSSSGWVVAYRGSGGGDPDGIFKKTVDSAGVVGPEIKVNIAVDGSQEQPDIAMFDDGRHAVIWRNQGDVFFQRYDAAGNPVAGDQDGALNTTTDGDQSNPTIAASPGFGNFYAAAWQGTDTGGIYGRYIGGDAGFEFNAVTGQNDDFLASSETPGDRRNPAVAIGGEGYVVIGWQDDSVDHAGVYYRRLPLPQ